jgi:4-diphosphocytidyl-2-C-methyl-D-erythritol kinase
MEQFTVIDDKLLVRAPAKINLSLLIAGKRPDGFHEIETVMAKVDLYDELLFEKSDGGGISLVCDGKYKVAADKDNFVYKAAEIVCESVKIKPDIKITVTKNIPIGAGLGGGSSDAAATLLGLNKFLNLELSDEKLHDMAASLGSDMNFFLGSPLAFCTGRGEKIQKIGKIFPFTAILFMPNVSVSTKRVYVNYGHDEKLYKELSRTINGLIKEKNVDLLARMCANMLANSCFNLHHELADFKSRIEGLGVPNITLSGSGSTMYCLLTSEESVERYQTAITSVGCDYVVVNNNRW